MNHLLPDGFRAWLAIVFALALLGPAATAEARQYRLGTGDRLLVTVFGHDDLSGEFAVDGAGRISVPLAGAVSVRGRTVEQAEGALRDALAPDYLRNPRVSVQVTNYRPFYIIGAVNNPGSFPYVSRMNVLTAVAVAGGFSTERARTGKVLIARGGGTKRVPATGETVVLPGDIVEILDRRF